MQYVLHNRLLNYYIQADPPDWGKAKSLVQKTPEELDCNLRLHVSLMKHYAEAKPSKLHMAKVLIQEAPKDSQRFLFASLGQVYKELLESYTSSNSWPRKWQEAKDLVQAAPEDFQGRLSGCLLKAYSIAVPSKWQLAERLFKGMPKDKKSDDAYCALLRYRSRRFFLGFWFLFLSSKG